MYHGTPSMTMIVKCERCETSFRIASEKLGKKGTNLRCAKCSHIFFVTPDNGAQSDPPKMEAASSSKDDWNMESFEDDLRNFADDSSATTLAPEPDQPLAKETKAEDPKNEKPKNESSAKIARIDLKPHGEVTEKPAKSAYRGPFITDEVSTKQRIYRIGIIFLVCLAGLIFGLSAMRVRTTPRDLGWLFQYGKKNLPQGIHIVSYNGRVVHRLTEAKQLHLVGEILNNSAKVSGPLKLLVTVFTPSGAFLHQSSTSCCENGIQPNAMSSFSTTIPLDNSAVVGSYLVSIEK